MEILVCSAFVGTRLLAVGDLPTVLAAAYPFRDNLAGPLLIFDHATGRQADFDWRGTLDDVLNRVRPSLPKVGPGPAQARVVSTEVTLLPRHWEWLNAQPARASGTLRRLVDEAMAREAEDPKKRRESLGRLLWSLAGNEPGFEEASRKLYGGDWEGFEAQASGWSGELAGVCRRVAEGFCRSQKMKTKKQLTNEYKRLKFPMGVFRIRNTLSGKIFLDSSLNMPASWNRHRFQLDLGNHPNSALQADWKRDGEAAFRFEVVSELKPREPDNADYRAELKTLEDLCFEELGLWGESGYHQRHLTEN